jgi:hypothetical protein
MIARSKKHHLVCLKKASIIREVQLQINGEVEILLLYAENRIRHSNFREENSDL